MKIICNNGEGREPNPCEPYILDCGEKCNNMDWVEFENAVINLPVYDQSGKLFTVSGEFEAELVWQYKEDRDVWYDCTVQTNQLFAHFFDIQSRQIYRISDPIQPTDQEKEETKTSETSNLIEKEKVIELLEAEINKEHRPVVDGYKKAGLIQALEIIKSITN